MVTAVLTSRAARADLRQIVVYLLCVASALLVAWVTAGWWVAVPRAAAVVAKPDWIPVHRAQDAFDLPARDLEDRAHSTVVRRHAEGGGRQDIMAWGEGAEPLLRVVVYRPAREAGVPVSARATQRALAEAAGLGVADLIPAGRLPTKFGDLPAATLRLVGAGSKRDCLATGDLFPGSGLAIVAVACNAGPELMERRRLACWLDRLTLMSAGGDDTLAAFFARAELRRADQCGESARLVAPTPGRADWISAPRGPKLRGRLAAR